MSADGSSAPSNPVAAAIQGELEPSKTQQRILMALGFLVLLVLPLFFNQLSGFLSDMTLALSFVVMALGLNIVVGFAGLLDLGYVAFFAIGAYTAGWLFSTFYAATDLHILVTEPASNLPGVHVNFLLVMVAAAVLCAIGGVLIGLPTLRLRGDYIAIVTLAFGEIIRVFAINGDNLHPFGDDYRLTAGRQGITPIDQIDLPFLDPFSQIELRPWYWFALALVVIALFVSLRLRDSRLGRAWIAIREDEVAAASMGIPLVKTKLMAYAIGAAFGGVAGSFQASYLNTVNADQFLFGFSILVLAMVILGGIGSIWGVVLGAITLSLVNTWIIPDVMNSWPGKLGLDFNLADVAFGVFGFILVLVMIIRPEGLLPERRHRIEMAEGIDSAETPFEVRG